MGNDDTTARPTPRSAPGARIHPGASLPLSACLVLLLAVHLCYVVGAGTGYVEWCLPYVDGCTSISRASRNPPALFVYRTMIPSAGVLIALYWIVMNRWLTALGGRRRFGSPALAMLGVLGAICLIANAALLGESDPVLRSLRRWLVLGFFFSTFAACALSAISLAAARRAAPAPRYGIVRAKLVIIALLSVLGGFNYLVLPFVTSLEPFEDRLQNAIEWHWIALLGAYFAASALAWRIPADR